MLASIARRGIEEPLEGVDTTERRILLNGFKRYRCARKLGIRVAPYASLGEDAALGIINLLRVSNDRSLTILEQARFIDELRRLHQMSVADIAEHVSRSKAWVVTLRNNPLFVQEIVSSEAESNSTIIGFKTSSEFETRTV